MPLSNPKAFFDAIRASLYNGSLPQSAVDNINLILGAWDMFFPGTDYRFVACSLGTAFNQVGASLTPIDEIGQGAGHSYGTPTGPYNQVYFGRGYVQLTFLANYETADKRLHAIAPPGAKAPILSASQKLVETPELANQPDIAAAILIYGMCEGWFTGKTLYEYFNSASNWAAAPDAIIGANAAAVAYVQKFGDALAAGGWPTKPVPQPAPPPAPPPAPVPTPPPSPATAPAAIPVEVMVAAGGPIALTVNLVPINVEQQSSLVSMIVDGTEYVGIRHTGGTGQKPAPSLQHRSMSMPTLPPNAAAWLNFGVTVLGAVAAANPAIFPVAGPQIVQAAGAILGVLGAFNGYLHLTSPAQAGPLGK